MSHLMNTYARLPVAFTHGQGAKVFDESGRSYLDALAGISGVGVKKLEAYGAEILRVLNRQC